MKKGCKILAAAIATLFCCHVSAQEATAGDVTISPNGTANLVISLTGSSDKPVGAQFDINLPSGVSVVTNSNGGLQYSNGSILNSDEMVSIVEVASGKVRVVIFHLQNKLFKAANGDVLKVMLTEDGLSAGDYKGSLSDIKFAVSSTKTITGSDATGHLKDSEFSITVSSPTGIAGITTDKTANDNVWYSLTGTKLHGRPSMPGIYIHNGKKAIIR